MKSGLGNASTSQLTLPSILPTTTPVTLPLTKLSDPAEGEEKTYRQSQHRHPSTTPQTPHLPNALLLASSPTIYPVPPLARPALLLLFLRLICAGRPRWKECAWH